MLVVTAGLQGTLLAMAIYFEYLSPKSKQKGDSIDDAPDQDASAHGPAERPSTQGQASVTDDQPSEDTPLLQSQ